MTAPGATHDGVDEGAPSEVGGSRASHCLVVVGSSIMRHWWAEAGKVHGMKAGSSKLSSRSSRPVVARVVLQAGCRCMRSTPVSTSPVASRPRGYAGAGRGCQGGVGEGDADCGRDVVEHDGQVDSVGDGAHVARRPS